MKAQLVTAGLADLVSDGQRTHSVERNQLTVHSARDAQATREYDLEGGGLQPPGRGKFD
jgi:hypothetical protein